MSTFFRSLLIAVMMVVVLSYKGQVALALLVILGELLLITRGVMFLKSNFFGPTHGSLGTPQEVALTFDDGPDPLVTPQVLSLLARYECKATFFMVASKAQAHPELVTDVVAQGHTIGSHDLTHHWASNFRLTAQAYAEIKESCAILSQLSSQEITLYRPPVGLYNPHIAKAIKKLGLTTVGWSATVRDRGNVDTKAIRRIPQLAKARDHSILIFHDTAPSDENRALFLASLEELIVLLTESGHRFVALSKANEFSVDRAS